MLTRPAADHNICIAISGGRIVTCVDRHRVVKEVDLGEKHQLVPALRARSDDPSNRAVGASNRACQLTRRGAAGCDRDGPPRLRRRDHRECCGAAYVGRGSASKRLD